MKRNGEDIWTSDMRAIPKQWEEESSREYVSASRERKSRMTRVNDAQRILKSGVNVDMNIVNDNQNWNEDTCSLET